MKQNIMWRFTANCSDKATVINRITNCHQMSIVVLVRLLEQINNQHLTLSTLAAPLAIDHQQLKSALAELQKANIIQIEVA